MIEYVDEQRGSSRTKRMVMSLPEGGCVVVIHESGFRLYLQHMIGDLRGGDFLKTVRIVTLEDCDRILIGDRRPIFLDHYVSEYAHMRYRNYRINRSYTWLVEYLPYHNARINLK